MAADSTAKFIAADSTAKVLERRIFGKENVVGGVMEAAVWWTISIEKTVSLEVGS